jgi:ribose 5-phosphate isomerase B
MSSERRILIASDHAGFALKAEIKKSLPEWQWEDLGPLDASRVDYPDFAEILGREISTGSANKGILVCGSGIGMCIAANKISGIRAAVVENPVAARLSREHNDANVLCLGSRFIAPEYGAEIVQIWLNTPFSEDQRHTKRLDKIRALENLPEKKKEGLIHEVTI